MNAVRGILIGLGLSLALWSVLLGAYMIGQAQ